MQAGNFIADPKVIGMIPGLYLKLVGARVAFGQRARQPVLVRFLLSPKLKSTVKPEEFLETPFPRLRCQRVQLS